MRDRKQIEHNSSGSRRIPDQRSSSPRLSHWGTVLMVGLCCMIGAGAGLYLSRRSVDAGSKEGLLYEANVVSGDIPGKTKEERQRELNSVVEEGMLNMSMNITPSGKASGNESERAVNWLIENPSNQGKLIRVEITRDDTGETIYETGAIRPGNYVESAPPDVKLPAGEYACTAVFFAYQEETERLIGQAAVKIKLTLQE